ncbi:MAG: phosphate uptake regulator PhoU [Candidatus Thermoplasmatota archaeon]|nr:phosphate uptake regulator PhoU [Candidatus Thermoplasmatota archaeon]
MPESRKVQITGGSTYIVSLPKDWVEEKEIEAGDSMILSPRKDGSIVVSPEREYEKKANIKELDITEKDENSLIRELIGVYMAGYSKIELRAKDSIEPELRRAIMDFTRMVIGPEVIEEADNRVILKDLIDPSEFSQKKGLRRMYLIVKNMHRDAVSAFEENDKGLARDIVQRDKDVDRLFWMITKHYNMLLSNPRLIETLDITGARSLSYMLVSRAMERIGDHAVRIAENVLNLNEDFNGSLKEEIVEESDMAIEILSKSAEAFFMENLKELNQAIESRGELQEKNDELMNQIKQEKKENVTPLSYIIESISRTGSYATDISEIGINYMMSQ